MAQNKKIEMTAEMEATSARALGAMAAHDGKVLEVSFTKRDGSARTLVGEFVGFVGQHDKAAVQILTKDGYRSANLWAITKVSPA